MDIKKQVTDQIIAALESGVSPWQKPWTSADKSALPYNFVSNKAYQGINVLILWGAAISRGYSSTCWMTYKQAAAAGGNVRKGERGTGIVFYSPVKKLDKKTGKETKYMLMKSYSVFNLNQIDGITVSPTAESITSPDMTSNAGYAIEECINYMDKWGVGLDNGTEALYRPSTNSITMPDFSTFKSSEGYAATLAHECAHSTGHKSRLNRLEDKSREGYAFEELVAELTSAFVCAKHGIDSTLPNHASYIASWLKALKGDVTYIFKAASAAQKAYGMITNELERVA